MDLESDEGIPFTVWKILKTMKHKEKCICTIKPGSFEHDEKKYFLEKFAAVSL